MSLVSLWDERSCSQHSYYFFLLDVIFLAGHFFDVILPSCKASWWDPCTSDGSIMSVPPPSSPWWIHVVYVGDILFISKLSFTSCQVLTTWLRQCVHGQGMFCSGYFCLTISMNSSTPMMNVDENGLPLGIQDLSICCSKSMQSPLEFRPLGQQWQN